MAADELGRRRWNALIREVRQAEISDKFPMERLMFLTKTLGLFVLTAVAEIVGCVYFDIVIAGPVCATVDTLIWNNW